MNGAISSTSCVLLTNLVPQTSCLDEDNVLSNLGIVYSNRFEFVLSYAVRCVLRLAAFTSSRSLVLLWSVELGREFERN